MLSLLSFWGFWGLFFVLVGCHCIVGRRWWVIGFELFRELLGLVLGVFGFGGLCSCSGGGCVSFRL